MKILIVEARFYGDLADEMAAGAIEAIEASGGTWDRISVPGALEIPAAIKLAHDGDKVAYDGYAALGCVIRGETTHYDYVCGESARGLQDLALQHNIAIGNGILTVENADQAWARANRSEKNKGADAANAAICMAKLKTEFGVKS
ncbi:6,7-dimethyl-8-ribityllumazine synthase [Kordiimonas sediminis]|uniref:6,7-dimethyl-8-ribityllumazine synthase n=1 Tax=Kordiimonas sediminis TaxID=1735581 RepID=A0A919AWD2_9PROT|nr:6,7-dimethyl-8-ribityllumazine synthase [Kordiimonas sediminis]GHF29106.1 6,7-dimethyl-8-ribityllumazine synthase [Kordiimonas sediminis]